MGLEKKGTDNIVYSMDNAFGIFNLLFGVWAGDEVMFEG